MKEVIYLKQQSAGHWRSQEFSPACRVGDHGFEPRMPRQVFVATALSAGEALESSPVRLARELVRRMPRRGGGGCRVI